MDFSNGSIFNYHNSIPYNVRFLRNGQFQFLAVTKTGAGTGTITSSPAGIINYGTTCNANFAQDQLVKLTATADSGSIFGGWQDCPRAIANSCNVTIDAVKTVTATFTSDSSSPPVLPIDGGGDGGQLPIIP